MIPYRFTSVVDRSCPKGNRVASDLASPVRDEHCCYGSKMCLRATDGSGFRGSSGSTGDVRIRISNVVGCGVVGV